MDCVACWSRPGRRKIDKDEETSGGNNVEGRIDCEEGNQRPRYLIADGVESSR